jgi:site-specific recombinase XerD
VFCTNQGGPVRHRNLDRQYFKPLLKAASLPLDWTLYELRHSAGSLLLATGANLRLIQELLGHSSITTTMDIYTHPEPGLLRSAVGALGEALLSSKARQSS